MKAGLFKSYKHWEIALGIIYVARTLAKLDSNDLIVGELFKSSTLKISDCVFEIF